MTVDTGYISFSVKYVVPSYWTYVDLSNNADDGSIRISCNIRSITGSFKGSGDPTFIDNKMIDLTKEGQSVVFDDGYVQSGDFTVKMVGKNFNENEVFYQMIDNDGTTVSLKYREGWFSKDAMITSGLDQEDEMQGSWIKYVIVIVEPASSLIRYTINSEALEDIAEEQEYLIVLKRVSDLYEISVKSVNIQDVRQE